MKPKSIKRWREGEERRGRGEERRKEEKETKARREKEQKGGPRSEAGSLVSTAAIRGRFIRP
jgi:hypothetical protein